MCISKDLESNICWWVQLLSVIKYANATLGRPGNGSSCRETVAEESG